MGGDTKPGTFSHLGRRGEKEMPAMRRACLLHPSQEERGRVGVDLPAFSQKLKEEAEDVYDMQMRARNSLGEQQLGGCDTGTVRGNGTNCHSGEVKRESYGAGRVGQYSNHHENFNKCLLQIIDITAVFSICPRDCLK